MKSSRSAIAMAILAGSFCAGWGPGGGSTNGLLPDTYHRHKGEIDGRFLATTHAPQPSPDHALFPWRLLTAPDTRAQGHRLIQDTIGCTLPDGAQWQYGPFTFVGEGLLQPSATFDDIHTCLVARLNRFGKTVRIFLSGPQMQRSDGPDNFFDNPAHYPYEEAVWMVSNLGAHAWPLRMLNQTCGIDHSVLNDAISLRVCGSSGGGCGLMVHKAQELHSLCKGSEGNWSCKENASDPIYHPAISTRLGPCAWRVLYDNTRCQLPANLAKACKPGDP